MKNLQDVKIEWEDGKVTIESFKTENEFFNYLDKIKYDTGIGVVNFETAPRNANWIF